MKKRENMIGVLVIRVSLCSYPIDILGVENVFLEEEM